MSSKRVSVMLQGGDVVEAQAPVIVSASRYTDIPAWYSDWFLQRLKAGYSMWRNPYNAKRSYVAFQDTRLVVFWSKNPESLLASGGCLDYLDEHNINSYIHFTLNDYESLGLEPNIPPLQQRIDTFKRLVDRLGYGKVIWRFDPMILTKEMGVNELLDRVDGVACQLKGYSEKLVFSFANIKRARHVSANMKRANIKVREIKERDMHDIALGLQQLNMSYGFRLASCCETIDLGQYGIEHNRCIDDELIVKYFSYDRALMKHLGVEVATGDLFDSGSLCIRHKNNRDRQRRGGCGCVVSKDIGQSDTCMHMCTYCSSNTSKQQITFNYKMHLKAPTSSTINGK